PYSAVTHFGGVTDWHHEPRFRSRGGLKDDQADYPTDEGDGDDEPFDDDDNNDTNDEDLEEEPFEDEEDDEEEHLDLTDSSAVPIVDPIHLRSARKTIRPKPPMSASIEAYIARHAALPSPPVPVLSPPLPLPSPLTTSPTDIRAPLGYRAAKIRMRALIPSTSRGTDIPEADMLPRKRACLTTLALRFEVGESSAIGAARQPGPSKSDLRRYMVEQVGYGITDPWDEIVDTLIEIAPTTLDGVDQRVTELDTIIRERTDEFEIRFEEAQDDRALLRARVNKLFKDRPDHRRTAMLMDREAMYARKAWVYSEDRNSVDYITSLGRNEILEARDPKTQEGPAEAGSSCFDDRSAAIEAHVRTLKVQVAALIAQTSSLQTQLTTSLGRIVILETRDPKPQEGPTEAGSSC
nr:hypothetical protein [Tanacetum cinerariifolium]